MRILIVLQAVLLLSLPLGSLAADVKYQHPNLTIVAKDEPLDSVLKAISREMRIFVTTPTGLNRVVSCDIQNQPIKVALKKLLGDMSYSLEWKDDGENLVGLTILAAGTAVAVSASGSADNAGAPRVDQPVPVPAASYAGQVFSASVASGRETVPAGDDAYMAAQRAEMDAQIAAEQEAHEAEMELRRQQEMIAHEARVAEEAERNEAEMAEYFESQGLAR